MSTPPPPPPDAAPGPDGPGADGAPGSAASPAGQPFVARLRGLARRPLVRGTGSLAGSQYVASAIGLATTVLAARLLGPQRYGVAALVMAFPSLLLSLVSVKTGAVSTRYIAMFRAEGRDLELASICKLGYLIDLSISVAAFVLVALTGWWVAPRFFRLDGYGWWITAYAASFPLYSLMGTSSAVLITWRAWRAIALLQVLQKVAALCVALLLILLGYGAVSIVAASALAQALIGVASVVVATRLLRRDTGLNWWRAPVQALDALRRELGALFGWNYLQVTLSGFLQQAPVMLLGRYAGVGAAGYYRAALNLTGVASYLSSSLYRVVYPELSARWHQGRASIAAAARRWTLRGGLPAGAALLLGIPLLPWAITLALGEQYRAMAPGAQLMMVGVALTTALFWLQAFFYSAGLIRSWVIGGTVWSLAVIGCGAWVTPRAGYVGMAGVAAAGDVGFSLTMLAWSIVLLRRGSPGSVRPAAPRPAPGLAGTR